MAIRHFIGIFDDGENDSGPTPTLPDFIPQFIIICLYLMYMAGAEDGSISHLNIETTDDFAMKAATYYYHYTLCSPAIYYFELTSWLNSFHITGFTNLDMVIGKILVLISFLVVLKIFTLNRLKFYGLFLLALPALILISIEILIWLFK